jgi:hypothetical protein
MHVFVCFARRLANQMLDIFDRDHSVYELGKTIKNVPSPLFSAVRKLLSTFLKYPYPFSPVWSKILYTRYSVQSAFSYGRKHGKWNNTHLYVMIYYLTMILPSALFEAGNGSNYI